MKNKDQILLEQAYQSIYLKENLEQILPSLNFQQTTKKALKYQPFEGSQEQMPPMSYMVAKEPQTVITVTADGKETQNKAEPNDIIISGPSKEKYAIKAAKFPKLYQGELGGVITPEQSPRTVAQVINLQQPITFKAPWGEDMVLKPGDYLVKDGDQGYYRIAKQEYEQTYNLLKPAKTNQNLSKTVKESLTNVSTEAESLLSTLTRNEAKQQILQILQKNPDLVAGLKQYHEKDPEGYKKSLSNFNTNGVSEHLIKKMAEGKHIGYYDFM
jgi:hypothetical protein